MNAPEMQLREALAQLLADWDLATWITDPVAVLPERSVKVDGDMPTSIDEFTYLGSPPTTSAGGRANALYRVQFYTRRLGGLGVVEEWAHDLSTHLNEKEYLPNILGISWAWETSRTYFDADTQRRSAVSVVYAFRGRR